MVAADQEGRPDPRRSCATAGRRSTQLLLNTATLSRELGGLVDDNQEQIGPMLRDLRTVTQTLVQREKDSSRRASTTSAPTSGILSNIIGTGPWFDAYASNLGNLGHRPVHPGGRTGERRHRAASAGVPRPWPPCLGRPAGHRPASCLLRARRRRPARSSADFTRAVRSSRASEVRILGVPVGEVTAVIPEGSTVRVEMEYDEEYQVPADAQAVIITPTLTADRFVQLTPGLHRRRRARGRRRDRRRGHRHPHRARPDLPQPVRPDPALGPNGVNRDGTLNNVLGVRREVPRRQRQADQHHHRRPVQGREGLR